MQNNLIGETFDDYEVIECVGQINPKRRTYYYKLKCKICGEEKISPKTHKNGFNGRYVHNKTTCTNTFKRLEIGKTYGDYTVIRYVDSKNNKNRYEVKCNICKYNKLYIYTDKLKRTCCQNKSFFKIIFQLPQFENLRS